MFVVRVAMNLHELDNRQSSIKLGGQLRCASVYINVRNQMAAGVSIDAGCRREITS